MTEGWVHAWKRRGWWRTNKEPLQNVDLWQRLDRLCQTHQVTFRWVRGHAGHPENEQCDQLSKAAQRRPNLPADEGYENKPASEGGRPRLTQAGQPCWKCGTPVVKQTARRRPNRGYYYEYYLWCPKCQATYEVEEARRLVEQPRSLF